MTSRSLAHPRSRSRSIATRAIIAAGCVGAIVSVLLLQFFVLTGNTTYASPPTPQANAACQGNSLCDEDTGFKKSEQTESTGTAQQQTPAALGRSQPEALEEHNARSTSSHADPDSPEWPNTVALCALMQTEHAEDVVEWLDYHRWLGVDKVFLRENADEVPDYLIAATQQHVDSGFLDLGIVPGEKHPNQNLWHNRCSQPDLAGAFSWIAYIDLDEFLILMEKGEAADEPNLKEFLYSHRNAAGLSLQWLLFGSSGHKRRPEPGGPLRHFSTCTGELAYQMKCMASTFHLCSTPMLGDTVHDCAYRYDSSSGRRHIDTDHPVILGDGDPVATHLTTVEAAIRAATKEKRDLRRKPITIGPKKEPPKAKPATPAPPQGPPPPPKLSEDSGDADEVAEVDAAAEGDVPPDVDGINNPAFSADGTSATTDSSSSDSAADTTSEEETEPAKVVTKSLSTDWKFSDLLTGGAQNKQQEQQSARSLLKLSLVGDVMSSIPDARAGETVCRSYSGHLNEGQHKSHKTVPDEQMLVLAHYVTRSFDDYISRKLVRPSGVYAYTFNRLSRTKAAASMSNETLFDQFEEEQHFTGLDPVCSSIVRHQYAERCCTATSAEEQLTGEAIDSVDTVGGTGSGNGVDDEA